MPLTENKRYTCSWKGKFKYAKTCSLWTTDEHSCLWDIGGTWIRSVMVHSCSIWTLDWQPQSQKKNEWNCVGSERRYIARPFLLPLISRHIDVNIFVYLFCRFVFTLG